MDADADNKGGEEVIDESVRYKGTVKDFNSRRGFGYIIPEGKTDDDRVFAHWRQIESSDEWPQLKEGQVVEYYLGKKEGAKRRSQKSFAAKITLEGGNPVTVAIERNYPNRGQRFTGTIKFFDARKGFGFVKPSADFSFEGTDFKASEAKIYIAREDIKTDADIAPNLKDDAEVEFALYKCDDAAKSDFGAGEVTKPGGAVFGEDDFFTKKTGWPKRRFGNKGGKGKGGGGFGPMQGMQMGQIMMMNGMPYMMMPTSGFGGGGMNFGGKRKKRKQRWTKEEIIAWKAAGNK